jgi:hypothetical protein
MESLNKAFYYLNIKRRYAKNKQIDGVILIYIRKGLLTLKPKKERKKNKIQSTQASTGDVEMASLELESTLIQSDRVQTPGPGMEYMDNAAPGSKSWSDAYQDFFKTE